MHGYYYDTWIEDGSQPIGYRKAGWLATRDVPAKRVTDFAAGMEIPAFSQGPVTRTEIVKYAAASWDFNPVHHDETFAKQARSGGIIAHGMMIFAYLGRVATDFLGTPTLSRLSARFMNVTRPGDVLTLGGQVTSVSADGTVVLHLSATNQKGEVVATGVAQASVPVN